MAYMCTSPLANSIYFKHDLILMYGGTRKALTIELKKEANITDKQKHPSTKECFFPHGRADPAPNYVNYD